MRPTGIRSRSALEHARSRSRFCARHVHPRSSGRHLERSASRCARRGSRTVPGRFLVESGACVLSRAATCTRRDRRRRNVLHRGFDGPPPAARGPLRRRAPVAVLVVAHTRPTGASIRAVRRTLGIVGARLGSSRLRSEMGGAERVEPPFSPFFRTPTRPGRTSPPPLASSPAEGAWGLCRLAIRPARVRGGVADRRRHATPEGAPRRGPARARGGDRREASASGDASPIEGHERTTDPGSARARRSRRRWPRSASAAAAGCCAKATPRAPRRWYFSPSSRSAEVIHPRRFSPRPLAKSIQDPVRRAPPGTPRTGL